MKSLVKISLGLAMVSCLVACSGSVSPEKTKEKLEADNYIVTLMDDAQYEASVEGQIITGTVGLEHYIRATKVGQDQKIEGCLYVWFFSSIDNADTFYSLNSSWFENIYTDKTIDFTDGQKNNAVWTGTENAAEVAGFNSLF